MNVVLLRLLQVLLFAPAPFFCYPWKPLLNAIFGDSYGPGIQHFRHGHYGRVNLALHCVALCVQVGGNVALLAAIDNAVVLPSSHPAVVSLVEPAQVMWREAMKTVVPAVVAPLGPNTAVPLIGGTLAQAADVSAATLRPFSFLTVLTWSLYLLVASRGPVLTTRVTSAVTLFAAYFLAPFITVRGMDVFAAVAFGGGLLVVNFLLEKTRRRVPISGVVRGMVLPAVLYWGMPLLEERFGGLHRSLRPEILTGVAVYLVAVAGLLRNPVAPIVVTGCVLCRVAGVLAAEPALIFLGYGFLGSLFQGITHRITKEEATLLALEAEGDHAKMRFEYSHVVFFPCLLFDACLN